jgi:hypothetical protein
VSIHLINRPFVSYCHFLVLIYVKFIVVPIGKAFEAILDPVFAFTVVIAVLAKQSFSNTVTTVKLTVVGNLAPLKQLLLKVVIEDAKVADAALKRLVPPVKDVQREAKADGIVVGASVKFIVCKDVHCCSRLPPVIIVPVGKVIVVKLLKSENVPSFNVTPVPKLTEVTPEQDEKTPPFNI